MTEVNMPTRLFPSAAILIGLILAGAVHAQVYRCDDGDGGVTFSGTPCTAAAAEPMELEVSKPSPRAAADAALRLQRSIDELTKAEAEEEWKTRVRLAIRHEKVLLGMSADEVRSSWGNPSRINRDVGAGGAREQWVYERAGRSRQYVYIRDNEVSSISTR